MPADCPDNLSAWGAVSGLCRLWKGKSSQQNGDTTGAQQEPAERGQNAEQSDATEERRRDMTLKGEVRRTGT